jgi:hypothetical protein
MAFTISRDLWIWQPRRRPQRVEYRTLTVYPPQEEGRPHTVEVECEEGAVWPLALGRTWLFLRVSTRVDYTAFTMTDGTRADGGVRLTFEATLLLGDQFGLSSVDSGWLWSIRENPFDANTLGPFADWLDDRELGGSPFRNLANEILQNPW